MKALFLLLICIIFPIFIIAQTPARYSPKPTISAESQLDSMIQWHFEFSDVNRRYHYIYDTTENTRLSDGYIWDTLTVSWKLQYKETFSYDENDNFLGSLTSICNSSDVWENLVYTSYSYNNKSEITTVSNGVWNPTTHSWDSTNRYEYYYEGEGDSLTHLAYGWDASTFQWKLSLKDKIIYNSAGKDSVGTNYFWSDLQDNWEAYSRFSFYYDEKGNDTLYFELKKNTEGIWESDYLIKKVYNEKGLKIQEINYRFLNNEWKSLSLIDYTPNDSGDLLLTRVYHWDEEQQDWDLVMKKNYYYSYKITVNNSLNSALPDKICHVLPNPASDYIKVIFENKANSAFISLFNINGFKVLHMKVRNHGIISIQSLPKGIYLYQVNNGGTLFTGKILIE